MTSLTPPQVPPEIIPSNKVVPTTKCILEQIRLVRIQVAETVTTSTACFENVLKPLIEIDNRTAGKLAVISMLRYASPSLEAREASNEAVKLMSQSSSELTAREDLYLLVKAVKDRAEMLSGEARKYLNNLLTDFTRAGHGRLDNDQIKIYLDTRNHIDSLRRDFTRNIRDDASGLWFSLEELDGISVQDLSHFTESMGQRLVHLRKTDLDIIMKYAKSPAVRKKVYVADVHKLGQNVDLFSQVLILRGENARRLGYTDHATFRLEKRVAKSPEWVQKLLSHLEAVLLPRGREEMNKLIEKKRNYLKENPDYIEEHPDVMLPWDFAFFARLLQEDLNIEHSKISEYFPLQNTVSAMLEIYASCLQIRFIPISRESMAADLLWDEDVEVWSVWDERETSSNEFIGYFYTDLLWRPHKHQGAQNVNLQPGYLSDDGIRVYAATVLMCSFPRPTSSRCTLLQHREVVTLFHEMGHGIHDLLSRAPYVSFHPHRSPPDFAEAPSVMLENWCWMKDELKRMSRHYTTLNDGYMAQWRAEHPAEKSPSQTIPDDLLDHLVKSRDINRALWYLGQLALARFDMTVHQIQSHRDCIELDPARLYNDLMERLRLLPNPDPLARGHPHADFGHLLAGYDAGYYSYLSAHVCAADIFETVFANNPRSQAAWERYRQAILEPGGSRDELEMLEEFLGHPPSPEALVQSLIRRMD